MNKTITFRLDKAKLTVINGDNTLCNNKQISGAERITVDTDLQITVKIKPDTYCDFSTIPTLNFSWSGSAGYIHQDTFTQENNYYTLTTDFQYSDFAINENLIITLTSYATEMYGYLQTNLTDCECNIQAGNIEPQSTTFILTCSIDKEFQITPLLTYGGNVERQKDEMLSQYFEKVNDTTFSLEITTRKSWLYIIDAEAVKKSSITDKYGLISVYRLTLDDLHSLVLKRFVKPELKPVTIDNTVVLYNVNYDYIDTAKFIVAFHKLNIPITTTTKQRVKFGFYDMELDCDIIENDIILLDFGSIHIQGIYNNSIDYEHTEINIYLPFVGFLDLNVIECMNKVINLKYQVNIINGDSLVLIYADNNLILSHSCNIALKIPYEMSDSEDINTQLEMNTNYLHNEQPFIITRTNKPADNQELPYHDTNFYAVLGTLSGYTQATELSFNVIHDFITLSEIEEIKSLVNKGIIL